jgi:hypothetical protein
MTLPMFPDDVQANDDTPLPLLVAKKWDFPLAYHVVDGEHFYAIQDWTRGLTGTEDVRLIWGQFKRQERWKQIFASKVRNLPYTASDGKTYKREFITAENLILIMQHLRELEARPILRDIKVFLNQQLTLQRESSSYEFTETLNFEPLTTPDVNPSSQSDDKTINSNHFHVLDSFKGRIQDTIKPHYYDVITNDICIGLWKRTPQQLKIQLGSSSIYLNKDHMSPLARSFHEMVCEIVKTHLAYREDLRWWEIRQCVRDATIVVRNMINQAEVFLQIDIATGRPLLTS